MIACALALLIPQSSRAHPGAEARVEALSRQLREEPESAALYETRGIAHRRARQWRAALADLARALELDPGRESARLQLAWVNHERGAAGEALAAVDQHLRRRPEDAEAHLLRARVLRDAGRRADAAGAYHEWLARLAAPRPDDYLEGAANLAASGRSVEALRVLDDGIEALGAVAGLQLAAVEIDVARADHESALRRLDLLLARAPRQAFWLERRGRIAELAGRPVEAQAAYAQALAVLAARGASPRPPALAGLDRRLRRRLEGLRHGSSGPRAATAAERQKPEEGAPSCQPPPP